MKSITLSLILFSFILNSCSSNQLPNQLEGKWKVTDAKTNLKTSQTIIDHFKIISLASSYEFTKEGGFTLRIDKNSLENGREHQGSYTIADDGITLKMKTTKLLVQQENGEWKQVIKDEMNKSLFNIMAMKVKVNTAEQLTFTEKEKEKGGLLFYTLQKLQ